MKDRSHPKVKEPASAITEGSSASLRGSRGRGASEGTRGGRSRGSDRGRSSTRGLRGGLMNGTRGSHTAKVDEAPSAETPSWDTPAIIDSATPSWDSAVAEGTPLEPGWESISAADVSRSPQAEQDQPQPSSKPDGTRSWASMFSKPKPAPAPKAPRSAPSHDAPIEPSVAAISMPSETDMVGLPPPPMDQSSDIPNTPPTSDLAIAEPPANITPSKDELTETNLEQVLDVSGPPPLATAASTVASTIEPQHGSSMQSSQQQSGSRPPLGGYATSAYKATGIGAPGRSVSYQRKIMEQQEAVVMPENHAVDRAAVQFGSMGLNGTTEDVDIDSDREDAETRVQPPQYSPIAPRASLPPAPQQQVLASQPPAEAFPTPRQAPGLPPPSQPSAIQQPSGSLTSDLGASQQPSQSSYQYNSQYDRYGAQPSQHEASAPASKIYEPFGQQIQQPRQYDGYPATSQAQSQPQHQPSINQGGFSSAPNETPSYYTSDNQRNAYQYYSNYGQQPQPNSQDSSAGQQRGSTLGAPATESNAQLPPNQGLQHGPGRYGQPAEAQNSGHSTPNPSLSGPQQPTHLQTQPMMPSQGQGQTGGQHGGYSYNQPYYPNNYYQHYMNQVSNHPYGRERPMFDDVRRYDDQILTQNNQYGYGGNQGGYGGGPFGGAATKQGMYGQHHQGYGISAQTAFDQHSSSPANVGAFSQQPSASGRDSAAPSGLSSYGRTGSTQPSETSQQYVGPGASHHGSIPDAFGRPSSGFPGQNAALGSHMAQQAGSEERYGDLSKGPGGPSPALGQPSGRPGSAANTTGQTGLPPSQGQNQGQQGYGGFMAHPMHGQQGSQYGAGPGAHHQYGGQNHQAGGYGGYQGGYGGSSYGNNRGGWGGSYGH